ncbi:acylphosphatase [Thiolapillus sp.]
MICMRCIVTGRVQGVWFRETTRRKAQELALSGSALNLPDGTVEVIACGQETAVKALQDWLWTGSPLSRVDQVLCKELPGHTPSPGFHTG